MPSTTQHELTISAPLLRADGRLTEPGWSRAPVLDCDLEQVGFYPRPFRFLQRFRRMASPDGRLDLVFTPFLERVAKTDLLVITSEVHQLFGHYSGTMITDDGERMEIDGLTGFAEEHHARW